MTTELRQAINKISVAGAVKEADFKSELWRKTKTELTHTSVVN